MPDFTPRASRLGSYFLCDYRAALDRYVANGTIEEPEDHESDYGKLGTCIHYVTQKLLACEFPDGEEQPTTEDWGGAANLRGGPDKATEFAGQVAELGAAHLRGISDKWLAETSWHHPQLSGHIDFLSADGDVIVDLKTTQRVPDHQRIKPSHLYQLVAYWILTGKKATRGYVLYTDAKDAKWTLLCPFRFDTAALSELAAHTERYLTYLLSAEILTHAVPRLGSHCVAEYCPHQARCRNYYLPTAGLLAGKEPAARRASPPIAGVRTRF